MQAQHVQELHRQVDQLSAEVAAQRLALAAAARERDGARASALETSERLSVGLRRLSLLFCHPVLDVGACCCHKCSDWLRLLGGALSQISVQKGYMSSHPCSDDTNDMSRACSQMLVWTCRGWQLRWWSWKRRR